MKKFLSILLIFNLFTFWATSFTYASNNEADIAYEGVLSGYLSGGFAAGAAFCAAHTIKLIIENKLTTETAILNGVAISLLTGASGGFYERFRQAKNKLYWAENTALKAFTEVAGGLGAFLCAGAGIAYSVKELVKNPILSLHLKKIGLL